MADTTHTSFRYRAATLLLTVLAMVALVWFLKSAYVVTMPLVFAFFLAVLVEPVQRRVNRRLPRWLHWVGLLAAVLTVLAIVTAAVGLVWLAMLAVADKAPEYLSQLQQTWQSQLERLNISAEMVREELESSEGLRSVLMSIVAAVAGSIWSSVAELGLVLFLAMLILMEWNAWQEKTRKALAGDRGRATVETIDDIATKVRRYLLIRTVISAISGVLAGLWLWALGVDFALFWGLLTFVLNYVPNIGSVIAAIPPPLVALLQYDLGYALVVAAGLTFLEMTIGNLIDPRLEGRTFSISPVVILVSIVLWSWMWGVAGALLAVPITVTLVTIFRHTPRLAAVAELLSRNGRKTDEATRQSGRAAKESGADGDKRADDHSTESADQADHSDAGSQ